MEGSNLRALIDDRRFQQYHEATLEPREFNVFDVLRNADYEIRHSNVIAWLLQPDDTHGLNGRFLRWFVDHLNERADKAGVERILATDYEASNIDVERELDYVDITVFFKRAACETPGLAAWRSLNSPGEHPFALDCRRDAALENRRHAER